MLSEQENVCGYLADRSSSLRIHTRMRPYSHVGPQPYYNPWVVVDPTLGSRRPHNPLGFRFRLLHHVIPT